MIKFWKLTHYSLGLVALFACGKGVEGTIPATSTEVQCAAFDSEAAENVKPGLANPACVNCIKNEGQYLSVIDDSTCTKDAGNCSQYGICQLAGKSLGGWDLSYGYVSKEGIWNSSNCLSPLGTNVFQAIRGQPAKRIPGKTFSNLYSCPDKKSLYTREFTETSIDNMKCGLKLPEDNSQDPALTISFCVDQTDVGPIKACEDNSGKVVVRFGGDKRVESFSLPSPGSNPSAKEYWGWASLQCDCPPSSEWDGKNECAEIFL